MHGVRIVGWFVGSWLSRIYLVLVVVATVWASVSLLTWDGEAPNYADVGPTALTLPGSTIGVLIDRLTTPYAAGTFWWTWLISVTVGALINAVALNGVVALTRRLYAKAKSSGRATAAGGAEASQSGRLVTGSHWGAAKVRRKSAIGGSRS